jgi:ribosomal protein S11
MVTITDTNGETISLGVGRHGRLQGRAQEHAVRRRSRRENGRDEARKHGMLEVEVKGKGPAPAASRRSSICRIAG